MEVMMKTTGFECEGADHLMECHPINMDPTKYMAILQ